MKRLVFALVLGLFSALALALPSPKDIETAVNAGQLTQAEAMLREVIRDKPASARAHYELGQVLARGGRNIEAGDALRDAQRLDPSLKFARDPQHFRDLLNKTSGAALSSAPTRVTEQPVQAPVHSQAPASPAFPWTMVLFGGVAAVAVWFFMRRRAAPAFGGNRLATAGSAAGVSGVAGAGSGYPQGYGAPAQGGGMGIGGAVLGGVAGLAAGYGLAKVLEHGSDSGRSTNAGDNRFTPIEPAAPSDAGSFDAGNGDSWDAADSGSGDSGSDDSSW